MLAYILRRLGLILPTLFGIMLINFVLVQFVPGGPIEQILAQLERDTSVFEALPAAAGKYARHQSPAAMLVDRACQTILSPIWNVSLALTNRHWNGLSSCFGIISALILVKAISAPFL